MSKIKIQKSLLPLSILLLTLFFLASCAGNVLKPVTNFAQVKVGETVLVGRIILDPPLREGEQTIVNTGPFTFKNQVFVSAEKKYVKYELPLTSSQGQTPAYFQNEFGSTFYIKVPAQPAYFNIIHFVLTLAAPNTELAYLPAGLRVNIKPGDKAVYMGTIRYHRNEYMDIKKVGIEDDFAKAEEAFRKKFGTKFPLVKRLIQPVKK